MNRKPYGRLDVLPFDIRCMTLNYLDNWDAIKKTLEEYRKVGREQEVYDCIREIIRNKPLIEQEDILLEEVLKFRNLERCTVPISVPENIKLIQLLETQMGLKEIFIRLGRPPIVMNYPDHVLKTAKSLPYIFSKSCHLTIYVEGETTEILWENEDPDYYYRYKFLYYSYDPTEQKYAGTFIVLDNLRIIPHSDFPLTYVNPNRVLRTDIKSIEMLGQSLARSPLGSNIINYFPNLNEIVMPYPDLIRYQKILDELVNHPNVTRLGLSAPPSLNTPEKIYDLITKCSDVTFLMILELQSYRLTLGQEFYFNVFISDRHL